MRVVDWPGGPRFSGDIPTESAIGNLSHLYYTTLESLISRLLRFLSIYPYSYINGGVSDESGTMEAWRAEGRTYVQQACYCYPESELRGSEADGIWTPNALVPRLPMGI